MPLNVRVRLAAAAVSASLVAVGCSVDQAVPSAPVARPSAGVAPSASRAFALTRKQPLKDSIVVSAVIDPKRGGTISIPAAGLDVTFPNNAVTVPTTVTVTALAGHLVAYEFGPHGTTFNAPVRVRQDLTPTNWYRLYDRSQFEAGYFKDKSQIDPATGTALIDEFLPVDATTTKNKADFRITHFSGYLLSTGREK